MKKLLQNSKTLMQNDSCYLKVKVIMMHASEKVNMCEYEVNLLTNEKVIRRTKLLKNNIKCQGHLKVKVIMLHADEKGLT